MKPGSPTESDISEWCAAYLARTLDDPTVRIEPDITFARMGLDSASSVHLIVDLEDWLDVELTPEVIVDYPTIAKLARHLAGLGGRERGG